jgi:hypothetical protein
MAEKIVIRKFNGDDDYSWAVFEAKDIKGITGVVLYGDATPIVCGCSKREAQSHKNEIIKRKLDKEKMR